MLMRRGIDNAKVIGDIAFQKELARGQFIDAGAIDNHGAAAAAIQVQGIVHIHFFKQACQLVQGISLEIGLAAFHHDQV